MFSLVGSTTLPSSPFTPSAKTFLPSAHDDESYPLSRPLFLLTNGEPTGAAKTFVDFLLSDRGQELVKKHGYMRLRDLGK